MSHSYLKATNQKQSARVPSGRLLVVEYAVKNIGNPVAKPAGLGPAPGWAGYICPSRYQPICAGAVLKLMKKRCCCCLARTCR